MECVPYPCSIPVSYTHLDVYKRQKQDCIDPEGMHGGWQTSGTVRVCRLAFNLWNGYTDPEHSNAYSPEDFFCCEFAPYFMEGVKIRYPEYCRELPPAKKQAEPAR